MWTGLAQDNLVHPTPSLTSFTTTLRHDFHLSIVCVSVKAAGNGEVPRLPAERQELMEKEKDSSSHSHHSHPSSHHSHIKSPLSDDGHSHLSGISGSHSHSSRSSHSRRRGSYDRLQFPRHDLQTLGMLGKCEYTAQIYHMNFYGIYELCVHDDIPFCQWWKIIFNLSG